MDPTITPTLTFTPNPTITPTPAVVLFPQATATRLPSITPLPTRPTPEIYPPDYPAEDWHSLTLEDLGISVQYPPDWKVFATNQIRGMDGSLTISTRAWDGQDTNAPCLLEVNRPDVFGQQPQVYMWNSANGFYGCNILSYQDVNRRSMGLILAWYPVHAQPEHILEIHVNADLSRAVENGLRLIENETPANLLLASVPAECRMNKEYPQPVFLDGLQIDEYRLTSDACRQRMELEAFTGLVPAEALKRVEVLRAQDESDYREINRLLAPSGFSIRNKVVYQGETAITGTLGWTGMPIMNPSQTRFFLPIIEWMSNENLLISNEGVESDPSRFFYSSLGYVPTRVFIGEDLYTLAYNQGYLTKVGAPIGLRLTKNEDVIYETTILPPSPASVAVRGLYAWDGHWILEIADVIIQDGVVLNQALGYSEMFTWRLINGKPFYFYRQDGQTRLSYDSQTLPHAYQRVIHDPMCCSAGALNMELADNALAFFALRDGYWYYVIVTPSA